METIRVLLIAADPLARAGLASLLIEASDLEIIGQIEIPDDWDQALTVFQPHVVFWDLGWEGESPGSEVLDEPGVPLVLLVPDFGSPADLLRPGVSGLLPRDASARVVVAALRAAGEEFVLIDRNLVATLVDNHSDKSLSVSHPALKEPLTGREEEVLQLLANGLTNKAIAQKLGISPHTVKFHVTGLLRKLDAQSRTEAVTNATRLGLLAV